MNEKRKMRKKSWSKNKIKKQKENYHDLTAEEHLKEEEKSAMMSCCESAPIMSGNIKIR